MLITIKPTSFDLVHVTPNIKCIHIILYKNIYFIIVHLELYLFNVIQIKIHEKIPCYVWFYFSVWSFSLFYFFLLVSNLFSWIYFFIVPNLFFVLILKVWCFLKNAIQDFGDTLVLIIPWSNWCQKYFDLFSWFHFI